MTITHTTCTGADRLNTELAAAVDAAIVLAEQQDVRTAAAFLADHGAGFALTCRVLAEPTRRRAAAVPRPRIPT